MKRARNTRKNEASRHPTERFYMISTLAF